MITIYSTINKKSKWIVLIPITILMAFMFYHFNPLDKIGCPVNRYDSGGSYDRNAAVQYASSYFLKPNLDYYLYKSNCANFVSQCLLAGGIPMSEEWYSPYVKSVDIRVGRFPMDVALDWQSARAWSVAGDQYHHFRASEFFSEEIILSAIAGEAGIKDALSSHTIQAGDLMFFDYKDDGKLNHAVIISRVDAGMIYYAGNTNGRFNTPLTKLFNECKNAKVYILSMN